MAVIELRQYALLPGKRDELIDLFEAELLEPQERCGMRIIGTFRDLDDPDRFVWIRGFPDMDRRAASLHDFYRGPVWRRHRAAANATMIDSDDVLLLRPARDETNFSLAPEQAPPDSDRGVVQVGIVMCPGPIGEAERTYFEDRMASRVEMAGATVLACLVNEVAENTFPALPVRESENVLVWVAGFPDVATHAAAPRLGAQLIQATQAWPGGQPCVEVLSLEPTRRSRLTGDSQTVSARADLERQPA